MKINSILILLSSCGNYANSPLKFNVKYQLRNRTKNNNSILNLKCLKQFPSNMECSVKVLVRYHASRTQHTDGWRCSLWIVLIFTQCEKIQNLETLTLPLCNILLNYHFLLQSEQQTGVMVGCHSDQIYLIRCISAHRVLSCFMYMFVLLIHYFTRLDCQFFGQR